MAALARLQVIREALARLGYGTGETVLGIFSLTGFTPERVTAAAHDPAVALVDLERMYDVRS